MNETSKEETQLLKEWIWSDLKNKKYFEKTRDAVIFGLEDQSISLANQLRKNKWESRFVYVEAENNKEVKDFDVLHMATLSYTALKTLELEKTEAFILMLSDEDNYKIAALIFNHK